MEDQNEFNPKLVSGEHPESFKIVVSDAGHDRIFWVRPLGNERYELLECGQAIGTVQLDERDHAHCQSQGCEIDLPILRNIRDQIKISLR